MKRLSSIIHHCFAAMAVRTPALLVLQLALFAPAISAQQTEPEVSSPLAAEPIPFKESDFDLGSTITEVVFLLVGLCVVTAVIIVFVRKRLVAGGIIPERSSGHIQLLDKKVLSSRTTAVLLDVDGERVLVCESGSGVALSNLPAGTEKVPESNS